MKSFTRAIVFGSSAFLLALLPLPVAAQESTTDIVITTPQSGGTMVNVSAQVTGMAPPNTLVSVTLTDVVPNRPNVKHQPGGKVSGTTTSDKNGQWIFVPQQQLIPGQFAVRATYTGENNVVISSRQVPFVVVDREGNSVIPSIGLQRRIAIGLMFFAALLFAYIFVIVRRNGGHFVSKEAEKIEHELEDTHDELVELRERVARDEREHAREKHAGEVIRPHNDQLPKQ